MAIDVAKSLADYAMGLGDDVLVLAQRLVHWCSRSPSFEEDVAFANIALDLLGQARSLLSYAGDVEGQGRDEDALAYDRDPSEFKNLLIVELPNGNFGFSLCRQLLFSAYQVELYSALTGSAGEIIAAIAGKAVKEVRFHRDHAAEWVIRLGDGTETSHQRTQEALGALWPYTDEMFRRAPGVDLLIREGVTVDHGSLRQAWTVFIEGVLAEATLDVPRLQPSQQCGRLGVHSEGFADLIAELQSLRRVHSGAAW